MALKLYPAEHYIEQLDELKSRRNAMVDDVSQLGDAIQALGRLRDEMSEQIHRLDCDRTSVRTILGMVDQPPPTR